MPTHEMFACWLIRKSIDQRRLSIPKAGKGEQANFVTSKNATSVPPPSSELATIQHDICPEASE